METFYYILNQDPTAIEVAWNIITEILFGLCIGTSFLFLLPVFQGRGKKKHY